MVELIGLPANTFGRNPGKLFDVADKMRLIMEIESLSNIAQPIVLPGIQALANASSDQGYQSTGL